MSKATPQHQFLGNLLDQTREFGRDVMESVRGAVGSLDAEMFEGQDRRLFDAIVELLDEDKLPTPASVRAFKIPTFSAEHAASYIKQAGQLAEWQTYVEAIEREFESRIMAQALTEASTLVGKGGVEEAQGILLSAIDKASSRGSQSLAAVQDFYVTDSREERIQTPWPRLNDYLGGGLGFSGNSVMSLWVADSGTGKSSVAQQMIPGWLQAGHHILYMFGEGDKDNVVQEVTRFHSGLGYDELRFGLERGIQRVQDKYRAAADELPGFFGKLFVYDGEFDGQVVRREAHVRSLKLKSMIETGEAVPTAKLIVIIDNIDSAVSFDNRRFAREDQAYEYEARRFEQSAKRDGYHLMILSQTNEEGRKRQGPPEMTDIARAKVLRNRAAFVVTIHRPVTEADRIQTDKDGNPGRRARSWIAVRKARGGKLAELEFATNGRTGQWYDPEQAAF